MWFTLVLRPMRSRMPRIAVCVCVWRHMCFDLIWLTCWIGQHDRACISLIHYKQLYNTNICTTCVHVTDAYTAREREKKRLLHRTFIYHIVAHRAALVVVVVVVVVVNAHPRIVCCLCFVMRLCVFVRSHLLHTTEPSVSVSVCPFALLEQTHRKYILCWKKKTKSGLTRATRGVRG